MLLKLAALSMIAMSTSSMVAATTHEEKAGKDRQQWVYDNGANKGYVCAVMQQNGTAYDVYLPAIWPAPVQKAGVSPALTALSWLHYANQADAVDAINAYCPVKGADAAPIAG